MMMMIFSNVVSYNTIGKIAGAYAKTDMWFKGNNPEKPYLCGEVLKKSRGPGSFQHCDLSQTKRSGSVIVDKQAVGHKSCKCCALSLIVDKNGVTVCFVVVCLDRTFSVFDAGCRWRCKAKVGVPKWG
jgi:hypothetical protein